MFLFNKLFEDYLQNKHSNFKRYSGSGTDTLTVLLSSILSTTSGPQYTTEECVMATGHRGRLNVLALLADYPLEALLSKIEGNNDTPDSLNAIDDVVSHVSCSNRKMFALDGNISNKRQVTLSIVHNPSHLEASYPVALGKTRAKQEDSAQNKVLSLIVHGDAALAGQGLIYETLALHKTPNSTVNGSVHVVCNNQIGFTTSYPNSRSSRHTTDIFKAFEIPVIHVNAMDVEAVIKVGKLAAQYKRDFNKDIVINLIGHRKYGHNELDEPSFTQPNMYKTIRNLEEVHKVYREKLIEKNLLREEQVTAFQERFVHKKCFEENNGSGY